MNYYNQEEIPDQKHFFTESSEAMLDELQPALAKVTRRALAISDIEFQVVHGMRTRTQHNEFWRKGVTIGNQSTHFYGHAVDLMPIIEGRPCVEAEVFDDVAMCMKLAGADLHVPLRWGGAWHCDNICAFEGIIEDLQMFYIDNMRMQDKRPRLDLSHFELTIAE